MVYSETFKLLTAIFVLVPCDLKFLYTLGFLICVESNFYLRLVKLRFFTYLGCMTVVVVFYETRLTCIEGNIPTPKLRVTDVLSYQNVV